MVQIKKFSSLFNLKIFLTLRFMICISNFFVDYDYNMLDISKDKILKLVFYFICIIFSAAGVFLYNETAQKKDKRQHDIFACLCFVQCTV